MKCYDHFINGQWVKPASNEYIDSIDPASGQAWARIARGNSVDVGIAVEAAHAAFNDGPWGDYSVEQRAAALNDLADSLEQRWQELVEAEVRDNGKRITEVRAQFSGLHTWYRYFAALAWQNIDTRYASRRIAP